MIPERKICPWCKIEKDKSCFSIRRKENGYEWLRMECKECENKVRREKYNANAECRAKRRLGAMNYHFKNIEKIRKYRKEYRLKNIDKIKKKAKNRYEKQKEDIKQKRKEYYRKNTKKHIDVVSKYQKENLPIVRERQRANHNARKQHDAHYVLMRKLRGRVLTAVKNKRKRAFRTMELIGCSLDVLMAHLESKFTDGMNWTNQGLRGWHIDHIKPISSFNLEDAEEQKKCFHYTNLQPLWWRDNISKSNKISPEYNNDF